MRTNNASKPTQSIQIICTGHPAEESMRPQVRALATDGQDWGELLSAAAHHGVAPVVCQRLDQWAGDLLPPTWRDQFSQEFARNTRRNLVLTAELFRVLRAFQANGVSALPYKGPVLAAQAYGDIALRQFADLDIVVPHLDIVAAHRTLAELAYRYDSEVSQPGDSFLASRGDVGQYSFSREGGLSTIELHTEKTMRYFPKPLDWNEIVSRAQTIRMGGGSIRTFSLEDTLCLLSVHGTKHFWERLCWICDLSNLVQLPSPLHWALAEQIARSMRCWRMVLLGLALAKRMLQAPLPPSISAAIQADPRVQSMSQCVHDELLRQQKEYWGVLQRLRFRMQAYETMPQGLRKCIYLATRPTEDDWQSVSLPRPLQPLFALVRPWRLLRKHGLGLARRSAPDLAGFAPTTAAVAERMLRFAAISGDDVLYDLGCGDGQIVVAAAKTFGIRAVGIDVDPALITQARANARRSGVSHLVEFRRQDARETDLTAATIVTVYLGIAGNLAIANKLRSGLRPGARIVSRDYPFPAWTPDASEQLELEGQYTTTFFLWQIPEPFQTC